MRLTTKRRLAEAAAHTNCNTFPVRSNLFISFFPPVDDNVFWIRQVSVKDYEFSICPSCFLSVTEHGMIVPTVHILHQFSHGGADFICISALSACHPAEEHCPC